VSPLNLSNFSGGITYLNTAKSQNTTSKATSHNHNQNHKDTDKTISGFGYGCGWLLWMWCFDSLLCLGK
jgi:hypothetical protein